MASSLHKALGLHWASPVVLRYQTADASIRPRDDTAVFRIASCTQGRTVSASDAPMLSMDDDNAERTVWWRCREWKCESWVAADGRQWLELYQGVRVALARPVRDAEQLQALADSWRDALAETYPGETVMPEPTRRRLGPRRHTERSWAPARRWMMPCRATAGVRPSAARAKGEHRARRPDYESLAAVRDDLEDIG